MAKINLIEAAISGNLLLASMILIGSLIFAYVFIFKHNWLFIVGPRVKRSKDSFGFGRTKDNPAYVKIAKGGGIIVGLFGIIYFIITLFFYFI